MRYPPFGVRNAQDRAMRRSPPSFARRHMLKRLRVKFIALNMASMFPRDRHRALRRMHHSSTNAPYDNGRAALERRAQSDYRTCTAGRTGPPKKTKAAPQTEPEQENASKRRRIAQDRKRRASLHRAFRRLSLTGLAGFPSYRPIHPPSQPTRMRSMPRSPSSNNRATA